MSEQNFDQQRQIFNTKGQNDLLVVIENFVDETASAEYGEYFRNTRDSGITEAERISEEISNIKREDLEVFDPVEGNTANTINLFSGQQSEDPGFNSDELNNEFKNRALVFDSLYDKFRPRSTRLYSVTAQGYGNKLHEEGRFVSSGRDFSEGFTGDSAILDQEGEVRGVRLDLGNGVYISFETGRQGYAADRSNISRVDLHVIGPKNPEEDEVNVEDGEKLSRTGVGKIALDGAEEAPNERTDSKLSEFMEETTEGKIIAGYFEDIQTTRQAIEDYIGEGLERHKVPENVLRHLKAKFLGSHDYLYDKLGNIRHYDIADNERGQAKQALEELSELSNRLLDTAEILEKNPKIRTGKIVDTYRADPTHDGVSVKILDKGWKVNSINVDGSIVVTKNDLKGKLRKKTVDVKELNGIKSNK